MNISTIDLVLLVMAVWRLSNILAHKEEGPFRLFWYPHLWVRRQIRKNKNGWVAKSKIADGLECEYCNSIWFGTILGGLYLLFGNVVLAVIFPLALSTGAIIIKHIVFLIKSIDTRYDQQNQNELELRKTDVLSAYRGPVWNTPELDRTSFQEERR
jgi:hypothetical protein